MPAGAQHARHFAQSSAPVRHVAQAERDRHAIERSVLERKLERVRQHGFPHAFAPGHLQHFRRKIGGHDRRFRQPALNSEREIAAASRQIEHALAVASFDNFRGAPPPPEIRAAAEDVIGQIVTPRDPAKHRANRSGSREMSALTPRAVPRSLPHAEPAGFSR